MASTKTKYGISFRDENGAAVTNIVVQLARMTSGTLYTLSNSGEDKSFYFNDQIPEGIYEIWVNGITYGYTVVNNTDRVGGAPGGSVIQI